MTLSPRVTASRRRPAPAESVPATPQAADPMAQSLAGRASRYDTAYLPASTVLVLEDDPSIVTVLEHALRREGYEVRATADMQAFTAWAMEGEGDVAITDVLLPGGNGLDLLPELRQRRPDLPVIVISAQSTLLTAVKANEGGAFEYLPKPFDLDALLTTVRQALKRPSLEGLTHLNGNGQGTGTGNGGDGLPLAATDGHGYPFPLVGTSPAMQQVYRVLARMVSNDLTVTLYGESGTGKELVARALHDLGARREGPFVVVNMAAIPQEMIERELFGQAHTGRTHAGRFEQAQGGTLFLDEIGDIPADAQTRLLRVLQQGEYLPVGGDSLQRADVRVICATQHPLQQLVDSGAFRQDLFYRLNVVPIHLPPLRERREDVSALARYFLGLAQARGLPLKQLHPDAIAVLEDHPWPGNVRELENMVYRLCALVRDPVIRAADVRAELPPPQAPLPEHPAPALGALTAGDPDPCTTPDGSTACMATDIERHLRAYFDAHGEGLPPAGLYDRILHEMERPLLSLTLAACQGNQVRAAQVLGINRNTLRKKLQELGLVASRGG